MSVRQSVRNPNLAIKVICTLDRDLRFFRFAGRGMRANHFFDFSWERSTCFDVSVDTGAALHCPNSHFHVARHRGVTDAENGIL